MTALTLIDNEPAARVAPACASDWPVAEAAAGSLSSVLRRRETREIDPQEIIEAYGATQAELAAEREAQRAEDQLFAMRFDAIVDLVRALAERRGLLAITDHDVEHAIAIVDQITEGALKCGNV